MSLRKIFTVVVAVVLLFLLLTAGVAVLIYFADTLIGLWIGVHSIKFFELWLGIIVGLVIGILVGRRIQQ